MGQWINLGTKQISVTVVGQAQPGRFSVSVSPTQVRTGGTVNVNVTVQNPNPFSTQFSINVQLFGSRQSKTITVRAGSSGTATFTFTAPTTPGPYQGAVQVSMYVPDYYNPPI